MDRNTARYAEDFFTWTQEQAVAPRQAARTRVNLPIAWGHLAEGEVG